MHRVLYSLLWTILLYTAGKAQQAFHIPRIASLASSVTDSLPDADCYFIGQAHLNKLNTSLELELLLQLHARHGVQFEILEYSHSAAIIMNEYLETGKEDLLKSLDSNGNFSLLRGVRQYNQALTTEKRIRFFGIDFEGRANNRYLKKAAAIICHNKQLNNNTRLGQYLASMQLPDADIPQLLTQIKQYLSVAADTAASLLGNYYIDLLLITQAQYGFSPRRDANMFMNFQTLYKTLSTYTPNPRFFGSFGYAHIQPGNTQSISYRLQYSNSSPVRGKVSLIGIQYFRSVTGESYQASIGNLSALCNKSALRQLEERVSDNSPEVLIYGKKNLSLLPCKPGLQTFSAVLLVYNYPGSRSYIFE